MREAEKKYISSHNLNRRHQAKQPMSYFADYRVFGSFCVVFSVMELPFPHRFVLRLLDINTNKSVRHIVRLDDFRIG